MEFFFFFSFANLFFFNNLSLFLISDDWKCLNQALKLVVLNVEVESVKHGVLLDALVEVSGTQLIFHWISLKHVNYNIVCALYPKIPWGGVKSIHTISFELTCCLRGLKVTTSGSTASSITITFNTYNNSLLFSDVHVHRKTAWNFTKGKKSILKFIYFLL